MRGGAGLLALVPLWVAAVAWEDLTIPCNEATTKTNSEIFGSMTNITALTTLNVACSNVPNYINFLIFQVHTYQYNVTLYQGQISKTTSVVGTNIGLYSDNSVKKAVHTFSIGNFINVTVQAYISVHGYNSSAPIPGGCNMVSPIEVPPTLDVDYDSNLITVTAAPAKISAALPCGLETNLSNKYYLEHTFYRIYLTEGNYEADMYFAGIRRMLTLDSILEHGEELPQGLLPRDQLRKLFSAYPGTGSIYVAVADATYGKAVYVPTHSYGCSPLKDADDCNIMTDVFSQLICATVLFAGLFVCFYGHRFFKTEMFLIGLLAGALVTYVVISLISNLDQATTLGAAIISGVFFGAIWWLFWWLYGMPIFSVLLASLMLGYLVSSVFMTALPDGLEPMELDTNYWSLFILIMVIVGCFLLQITLHANMFCCAIIGAYATIYPMDYYIGSSLKYILINTFRRALVPGFNKAILALPFQLKDAMLALLWVMLAMIGFLYQKYQNHGKAPFPPPPRNPMPSVTRVSTPRSRSSRGVGPSVDYSAIHNERTPLLNP